MSIEKSHSVILTAVPYRESSSLITLYSSAYGRISCIAKGIRRRERHSVPLERGSYIEHTLYLKPHRDLHQITDCSIIEFFGGIRYDLDKTALRDLLFDVLLASLNASDCNPHLFDIVLTYLQDLDQCTSSSSTNLVLTARTLFLVADNLGFSPDISRCAACNTSAAHYQHVYFSIKNGLLLCPACRRRVPECLTMLPNQHRNLLFTTAHHTRNATPPVTAAAALSLLRLATSYCCHHFDIRRPLVSLKFVNELFSAGGAPAPGAPVQTTISPSSTTLINKETPCPTHP